MQQFFLNYFILFYPKVNRLYICTLKLSLKIYVILMDFFFSYLSVHVYICHIICLFYFINVFTSHFLHLESIFVKQKKKSDKNYYLFLYQVAEFFLQFLMGVLPHFCLQFLSENCIKTPFLFRVDCMDVKRCSCQFKICNAKKNSAIS